MSVIDDLRRAIAAQQAGQLEIAEPIYRAILQADPNQPDANHLLGVLLGEKSTPLDGIVLIEQAIAALPSEAAFYNSLGNLLRTTGKTVEAQKAFEHCLQLDPNHFEALNNLANVQAELGEHQQAIDNYRKAIRLRPSEARLHSNLGAALLATDQVDAALAAHRSAVALGDDQPFVWNAYGAALLRANQARAAVVAFERAVTLAPQAAAFHVHLAAALREAGDLDRARQSAQIAVERDPASAEAINTLANVLADQGDFAASLNASHRAITLRPNYAEAYANLGVCHVERRDLPSACKAFELAIEIDPAFAEAHRNYGLALLTIGALDRGFAEYEWRWKSPYFRGHACTAIPPAVPRWTGESLEGKTILLQTEQGLGDAIQFARYVPLVADRGGRVLLQCPASLTRLFSRLRGVARIIPSIDECPKSIDFHCPLMSLPMRFRNGAAFQFQSAVPYLVCDPHDRAAWQTSLAKHASQLKIGLVWAGNPNLRADARRSIALHELRPLFNAAPHAAWISLQLGPAAKQAESFPKLGDRTDHLGDFADTAALIDQLDLIISVDTAVAHLAGALAKPTWVFIPRISDWRWQLDRSDSPWYPTMRLFRQRADDWHESIEQMAEALRVASYPPPKADNSADS